MDWYSFEINPKNIGWNQEGIKIVSLRDKEEFIEWNDVRKIRSVNDIDNIDFLNREFPDYVMIVDGKLNSFRYLEPKIAKQLMEAWQKYGKGPSENYRPPGKNKQSESKV